MEPFAEVVESLGGEGVVVPLPRELGLEVAAGCKRLASFYDLRGDVSVQSTVKVLEGRVRRDSSCQSRRAWACCSLSLPQVHPLRSG